jgi:hypothetical protein
MHTATELSVEQFAIEIDGRPAAREDALPGWDRHDRFGIVIDTPLGAVGASLLIQLVITAYYDADPTRRDGRPQYPEIYALHRGRGHGDLSFYDFWPPRKEVLVEDDPAEIVGALNDRAVTRLAVPVRTDAGDEERLRGWSSWADLTTAAELLRSAWAYSPSGRVPESDVVIRATDEITERNVSGALDPDSSLARYRGLSDDEYRAALPGPTTPADMERWAQSVNARRDEVSAEARAEAARLREQVLDHGVATETYRRLEPAEALRMLSAGG